MPLHKICNSIDYQSQDCWASYIAWRKFEFRTFESLDSSVHNSFFSVRRDADWKYVLTLNGYVADVVTDFDYAVFYCKKYKGDEVLNFDFIEEEDTKRQVLGYDILDVALRYSLLTNFGNDLQIVNEDLSDNGLILAKSTAIKVHQWFMSHMPEDHHVNGSRICSVYEKSVQPSAPH